MNRLGCCERAIHERLKSFDRKHNVSDATFEEPDFRNNFDTVLPGLWELLEHPEQWVGLQGVPWFPIDPKRVAIESVRVRLVFASLPFAAAVLRVQCPTSGHSHRIVNLGWNFRVLMSHFNAYQIGAGLNFSEFVRLARALYTSRPDLRIFECPMGVDRNLITYGTAWLLCHEMGHFLSPQNQGQYPLIPGVPSSAQERIMSEINADRMSFEILLHRIDALTGPVLSTRATDALAGVYHMLQTWNLTIPRKWGRQSDILSYGPRVGAFTPSPTLRWNGAKDIHDTLVALGTVLSTELEVLDPVVFQFQKQDSADIQEKLDGL